MNSEDEKDSQEAYTTLSELGASLLIQQAGNAFPPGSNLEFMSDLVNEEALFCHYNSYPEHGPLHYDPLKNRWSLGEVPKGSLGEEAPDAADSKSVHEFAEDDHCLLAVYARGTAIFSASFETAGSPGIQDEAWFEAPIISGIEIKYLR